FRYLDDTLCRCFYYTCFFFFNATATTEFYTLSLHDALPICVIGSGEFANESNHPGRSKKCYTSESFRFFVGSIDTEICRSRDPRSEEHTSELQSRENLVCRLLLEKKKIKNINKNVYTVTRQT